MWGLNFLSFCISVKIIISISRVFCPKAGLSLQTQRPRQFYQELNRCFSFPLLSAPYSLFSIWTDLKRSEKIPRAPREGESMDLTNWTLWTSPKFTTEVKYQFHQGFWPDERSVNPNHSSSPVKIKSREKTWIMKLTQLELYRGGQCFCYNRHSFLSWTYFWSLNFFRHTMHSESPVVNLAEPTWNTFGEQVISNMQQSFVTDI